MLKIKHLFKQFGTKKVLDNISVAVGHGEIAVFLGQSGVGKSTLLRVLNNLDTADMGTVELDGKKLDLSHVNQTHTVGMVFQHFNLFEHLTVLENITLPLEKVLGKKSAEAQEIAHQLLKRFGLDDKSSKYISQLSGGQKQRLAIARTLALTPKIICLDEPTSALDPMLTSYVAQNITQLAQDGYIVLVATHDTALLDKLKCTIHLMHDGKIIQSADSADFKKNKDAYQELAQFVAGELN